MPKTDSKALQDKFNQTYDAETVVCYLRLITAAILKRDRDIYEAFVLDSYPTIDLFVSHQVEPSKRLLSTDFKIRCATLMQSIT